MTTPAPTPAPADRTPGSNPVLRRALLWGGVLAAVILVVGGTVGYLVAGASGLLSAVVGTVMAVVFMGITAGSILFANRFANSDVFIGAFFGIVLGGWVLKLIVFVVLVFTLRGQPWLEPQIVFLSIVAGVVASLAVDIVVMMKTRVPYTDAALPKPPAKD